MVYDKICILYVCNYTLSSNVLSVMYVNQIKEYVFGIFTKTFHIKHKSFEIKKTVLYHKQKSTYYYL